MKKAVYSALMLALTLTAACSKKNEEPAKANPLAEQWIASMREELPKELCKEAMYFRQCFQVTEVECINQSRGSFDKCLPNFKNDILKNFGAKGTTSEALSADGGHWGAKTGECTGLDYEKTLLAKRINSDKCNDPKNWMGN